MPLTPRSRAVPRARSSDASAVRRTSASMSRPSTACMNTTPSRLMFQPTACDRALRGLAPSGRTPGDRHRRPHVVDVVAVPAAADADPDGPAGHVGQLGHAQHAGAGAGLLELDRELVGGDLDHALGDPRAGGDQRCRRRQVAVESLGGCAGHRSASPTPSRTAACRDARAGRPSAPGSAPRASSSSTVLPRPHIPA